MASHTPERWNQAVSDGLAEAFRIKQVRTAAPELLAALEALVARNGDESINVRPWSEVWGQARAAIRKARGGE